MSVWNCVKTSFAPPPITPFLPLDFSIVGETVKFDCRVCGTPTPEVTWWKDGKELVAGEKYEFKCEGQIFTLIIRDTMPEDRGVYTCQAHNKNGTVRYHPELLVRGGKFRFSHLNKARPRPQQCSKISSAHITINTTKLSYFKGKISRLEPKFRSRRDLTKKRFFDLY